MYEVAQPRLTFALRLVTVNRHGTIAALDNLAFFNRDAHLSFEAPEKIVDNLASQP